MCLMAGHRPKHEIYYHYDKEGEIICRYHLGVCMICNKAGVWKQYLEAWIEDDNGEMTPDWKGSGAWSFQCFHCGWMASDPYEDGLIRIWPPNGIDITLED